jgi:hypothetical protein
VTYEVKVAAHISDKKGSCHQINVETVVVLLKSSPLQTLAVKRVAIQRRYSAERSKNSRWRLMVINYHYIPYDLSEVRMLSLGCFIFRLPSDDRKYNLSSLLEITLHHFCTHCCLSLPVCFLFLGYRRSKMWTVRCESNDLIRLNTVGVDIACPRILTSLLQRSAMSPAAENDVFYVQ